eukprot:scaffold78330_cov60-Phaeocystis_antarctica.AAC.3
MAGCRARATARAKSCCKWRYNSPKVLKRAPGQAGGITEQESPLHVALDPWPQITRPSTL